MSQIVDSSTAYLNNLENLNLYSPANVYELNSSAANRLISTVVDTIVGNNFDFNNSILGNSLLPTTPIQKIANIQLAQSLASNVVNNLATSLLPTINIGSTTIQFSNSNYWMISSVATPNTLSSLLQTIIGLQPPTNFIPYISSTFTSTNSNDYLKANRGQGQIDSYNNSIKLNDFSPDNLNAQYGVNNIDADAVASGSYSGSLEVITNNLISSGNTLVNGYPSSNGGIGNFLDPNALAYNDKTSGDLLSKGDGTYTDDTNTKFLRVFKKNSNQYVSVNEDTQYNSTGDLMKFNHGTAGVNSVLQTVFPNISPIQGQANVKNLMFSIENLANTEQNRFTLKPYEKGENNGRIMWFPPYNLDISESVSVDWENVKFVGRTEPIYTYNGSERSMSLGFTLIVDYPSEFNKTSWLNASNNDFDKFFRQNNNLSKSMSPANADQLAVQKQQQVPPVKQQPVNTYTSPFEKGSALVTHFDNDVYSYQATLTQDNNGVGQKDNDDFSNRFDSLIQFLNGTDGNLYQIFIEGYTSTLDDSAYNLNLSFFRAKSVYNKILSALNDTTNSLASYNYSSPSSSNPSPTMAQSSNARFNISSFGESKASDASASLATVNQDVLDRTVRLYITYNSALNKNVNTAVEDSTSKTNRLNTLQSQNSTTATNNIQGGEQVYFEQIKNDDNKILILDKYSERLKYFSPMFHSQTPEDFNTRLTFLHQCTKQGKGLTNDLPNSIFGTPPVCILRLGDFFHTKIIINSINYNFDPLIWDTNPEGIGMQPMLCNVTLDCKIIGGESLQTPLTTLQNALNYNFYANTEVYDTFASVQDTTNSGNTQIIQNQNSNQVQKVNSQTARQNGTTTSTAQSLGDNVSSTDGGNTGTISYNDTFTTIISYLTDWSNNLSLVNSNSMLSMYINGDTININSYNLVNKTNIGSSQYVLMNNYYSKINSTKTSYTNLYNQLNTISSTGMDANKIITQDTNFTDFTTLLTMVQSFHDTVLNNISSATASSITTQLTSLTKYNSNTLQNLNFTT